MVEGVQISLINSLAFFPYSSAVKHLVNHLVNNQILLWSSVVLFIVVLRWLTLPRRHVG
jgi:putative Ca2+/H+ antiporter (TMEM165/GDT1 family)